MIIPNKPRSFQKMTGVIYLILFAGITFVAKILGLLTDYFWFGEVNLSSIFTTTYLSKWGLGISGAVLAWVAIFANLKLAQRWAKQGVMVFSEEEISAIPNFREIQAKTRPLLFGATLVLAYFIGSWSAGQWETVLQFWHATPFGTKDPLFNRDIGFYVFSLPFYKFVFGFIQSVLILSGVAALVAYVLEGKVMFTNRGFRISVWARNHLIFLAGLVCVMVGFYFQLKIFDLLNTQRTVAPGPGYADIHAHLPALKILRVLAFASAVLFWTHPFTRNGILALAGAGLLVGGLILSTGYTAIIQRFVVGPNEIVKETPFIRWAVEHTRKAYGIDQVQEMEFDPAENLTVQALKRNAPTINNIRLWDHSPLLTTFGQLQEIRTYYEFMDVDNDRYRINGEYRQVMLSPRELIPSSLPSRIWINEHLTYTHGYGLTMGPVNRISPEGLPEFFIKDLPPQSSIGLKVTRPEIYYGEAKGRYVIVKTESKEFDYPSGDENIYTRYEGTGGVLIGNFFKKLLFAAHFKELKILLSGDIKPESKILYHRNIQERLSKALPFLRYDQDPYLVISNDGRLYWIVDAYTTTDRYPFSQRIPRLGNYIRNSVKAVVDAYNGTMRFYVADESDPIIQTYSKIFPEGFKPLSEMPDDLKEHIRYPQDLFTIQSHIYATYHMTDPQVFYNKEDLWKVPEKAVGNQAQRMAPYYTIMKLASVGKEEEFILMVPFTPARKDNMIAWMAARCDAPNYGKLLVYNFPKQRLVYGPQQIESRIDQDAEISKQLTLWNQGGVKVIRGSLLVIPIESSLIYVQPLYLEAVGGGLPELKRVIVAHGNTIVMEENLENSLSRIFSGRLEKAGSAEPVSPAQAQGMKELIQKAQQHFERAQSHLKRGDWSGYGEEMKDVERLIKRMSEKSQ
jgi:uncharacterized protein